MKKIITKEKWIKKDSNDTLLLLIDSIKDKVEDNMKLSWIKKEKTEISKLND